ncbi:MAG TPA: hypothetical protein VGR03_05385 [Candidatus Acidoferrum sp.]|nr:hypothetical protein [Candidatus Acidoferrum sp.]
MTLARAAVQKRGLDYFRHVVGLTYREIGALQARNHQVIFSKANIAGRFFGQNRKAAARALYKSSLSDTSITQTLGRYAKDTGLTLEDVYEAFRDGNWSLAPGVCAFGGPKWAAIANVAIQLGAAIQGQIWPEVARLADLLDTLEHNKANIIDKFAQLD